MKNNACALILPGAVAKGAYQAGVIRVLAEHEIPISHIVAASSGALNAVVYAAGIRAGRSKEAAQDVISTWLHHGSWSDSLHFSPIASFKGKGLSDHSKLTNLLHNIVKPCTSEVKSPVDLKIVVAPLNGLKEMVGKIRTTTFEGVLHFSNEDFDSQEGVDRIIQAATAASALPWLFIPVDIPGLGPCVDGAAVNNSPIKYALDENDIDHIIIPVPFPASLPSMVPVRALSFAEQIWAGLINERLFRDLKNAEMRNRKMEEFNKFMSSGELTLEQQEKIKSILGWRPVQIDVIQPPESLEGNFFSGFLKKRLRIQYVEEGLRAGRIFFHSNS